MARFDILFIFNIILIPLVIVHCERDFYKILQVNRGSSTDDIKKSFRKLARQLHPDKHQNDPKANQNFMDLNDAYSVLSDPKKKSDYDRCGEECVSKDDNSNVDSFASFFGFGFGNQNEDRGETPKGATIVMDLHVSLEELYLGHFIELTRKKAVVQAAKGTRKCNCRQELITKSMGNERLLMQQTVCDECPNVKLVNEERELEIEVEPGMVNGQEIKFAHEGEPHVDGDPGDLIFKIRTQVHDKFERRGNDLYTNMTISLQDALVGFRTVIEHVDGHAVEIIRDKVTPHGTRVRKVGEGMPLYEDNTRRGNLYVTFDVAFPKTVYSEEDKTAIRGILNQGSAFNVYNGLQGF